ncbi:MAG: non-ribosomal peptide synthetase [Janthinobacterium lividum]
MKTEQSYYLDPIDFDPFAGPAIEQIVPLAKPQEEIWLSCKLGGDDANRCYNESVSLQLNGQLDKQALQIALQDLILRHQSLRSTFKSDGTQILIYQSISANLIFRDLSSESSFDQQKLIKQFLENESLQTYDLENGPLFRTTLFKLSAEEYYFTLSAHHIICDGWSLGVLLQDLSKLYTVYQQGQQPQLPEVPQMSLYITEQLEFAATQAYQQTKQFWIDQFSQNIPVTELPIDFSRPVGRTYKSHRQDFKLDPALSSAIKKTGAKIGCSFVVTLLSAFEILLHQITGQQEIVLGLPASGQAASGYYGLTGHCVNLLPIKSVLKEASTFNAYLKQRKTEILDALEQQQFSFGTLIKTLQFSRDASRIPLVPIVFNMDMNMDDGVAFTGLSYRLHYNPRAFETFEIFLNASGSENELTLEWSYNTQLFKPETIRWMMACFEELLQQLSEQPDRAINRISILPKNSSSDQEKTRNDTAAVDSQGSLPDMISQNLEKYAVKTAISFYDQTITNGELLSKSNQLANFLVKKGIRKGDLIGVALDRSIKMVMTILAVLKSGAAYIPLDPTYPHDRIHYMLQDSGAKLLLVNQKYKGQFLSDAEEILLEDVIPELQSYSAKNPELTINGSDLAYVLYTSGSTGRPKGVQIEHHSLINLLSSVYKWPGIAADDRMLALSTISFDIAGLELFLPLISGAEMVLADTKIAKDGYELLKLIKSANISLIQATPATFRMLLEAGWTDKLPVRIFCCGEALQPDLAKKLTTLCAGLWNMYGPTETTIYSTGKQIFYEDKLITIGRPIDNTQVYILDEYFNLLPDGEIGEIFIAGDGVARGYLNQVGLTVTRFPKDIISTDSGKKMYRTGDVGRLLPNGEIEYLGRADHQVKIRGHRVELGEIEAQLTLQNQINQVVVVAQEDQYGNQQLVAYVIAPLVDEDNSKIWINNWKTAIKEVLPPFMIPAHFILLTEFPLTPNNKIDRNALPKPQTTQNNETASDYIGPRTDAEKLVSDIWCSVLGLSAISINDNFFEIGGHSLSAVQIMSRLEKETGKRLPLSSLFKSSTIESLSLLLTGVEKSINWSSLVPIKPTGNKMPVYLIHGSDSNVLNFNSIAKHVDDDQPVYGLQARGLDGHDKPLDNMEEIASNYVEEIVKNNPVGPYAIAGYSFGGYVAVEMARQLRLMGKEVKMLGMIDTNAEDHLSDKSIFYKVFIKIFRQFKKLVWIILSLFTQPKTTITYQFNFVLKKIKAIAVYLGILKEETVTTDKYMLEVKQISEQHDIAYYNYKVEPFDGTIDLFRAKERIYYIDDFKFLGWKKYASKGVKIYEVPGDHKTLFDSPNDKEFATALQDCLNQCA